MRTIVEIPDEQIQALKSLGEHEKLSRAELIRRALGEYLARHKRDTEGAAFGLWQTRDIDGLAYQEKLRREWGE